MSDCEGQQRILPGERFLTAKIRTLLAGMGKVLPLVEFRPSRSEGLNPATITERGKG